MISDRSSDDHVVLEVAFREELLTDIDDYARRQEISRSEVIVTALDE